MKVIIAGGRDFKDYDLLCEAIEISGFEITEVVSGGARGADYMGEWYARAHGIPVIRFPADWDKFGKAAGAIRNAQMTNHADALIAMWNGYSKGTGDMIDKMRRKTYKIYVEDY